VKDEIAKAINEQRKDYDEDEVGVSWVSRHWSEIAERAKSERRKQVTIFKRGSVYWFNFMFNGQHIQRSSKQGNPNAARQIEAAYKTALAKGEVGITERKRMPGFKNAMKDFLTWATQEHQMAPAPPNATDTAASRS
jgi:hypothetical protein